MRATRADNLILAGAVDTPMYMPDHQDKSIANRSYLRVPLSEPVPRRLATMWLVQLSHIKTGNRDGLSFLGSSPFNRKVWLMAALQTHFLSCFPVLPVRSAAQTAGEWKMCRRRGASSTWREARAPLPAAMGPARVALGHCSLQG